MRDLKKAEAKRLTDRMDRIYCYKVVVRHSVSMVRDSAKIPKEVSDETIQEFIEKYENETRRKKEDSEGIHR